MPWRPKWGRSGAWPSMPKETCTSPTPGISACGWWRPEARSRPSPARARAAIRAMAERRCPRICSGLRDWGWIPPATSMSVPARASARYPATEPSRPSPARRPRDTEATAKLQPAPRCGSLTARPWPPALAVDSAGTVYTADSGNSRIRKVDQTGKIATIAGPGQYGYSGDGGPATAAPIGYVDAIALDPAGHLYFSDPYNHCVRRISPSGTIQTVSGGAFGSGGDGGPPTGAQLRYPRGVVVDRTGNLFVADSLNYRIRVVGAGGTPFNAAGTGASGFSGDGGPGPYAALNMPYALAADPAGDLYIADLRNFRIRSEERRVGKE